MMMHRKEILDFMDIGDIRSEPIDVQKSLIITKISEVENYLKSSSNTDSYNIDRKKLSSRQIAVIQNFFNRLLENGYLDAYWELWDFVDDYGNYEPMNSSEFDTLRFIVSYFLDQLHVKEEKIDKVNVGSYEIIIGELKKLIHIMELIYSNVGEDYDYKEFNKCVRLLEGEKIEENKENLKYVKNYLSRANFFNSRWAFDDLLLLESYGYHNLSDFEILCEKVFKDI